MKDLYFITKYLQVYPSAERTGDQERGPEEGGGDHQVRPQAALLHHRRKCRARRLRHCQQGNLIPHIKTLPITMHCLKFI